MNMGSNMAANMLEHGNSHVEHAVFIFDKLRAQIGRWLAARRWFAHPAPTVGRSYKPLRSLRLCVERERPATRDPGERGGRAVSSPGPGWRAR
jgi:hypothetical protein